MPSDAVPPPAPVPAVVEKAPERGRAASVQETAAHVRKKVVNLSRDIVRAKAALERYFLSLPTELQFEVQKQLEEQAANDLKRAALTERVK